jgi:TrpR-related protein YerC/YecD
MDNRTTNSNIEFLMRAILTLQTPHECLRFFEDLCTPSELEEMAKRLQAAKMLKDNLPYSRISEETGLSTATVSRVNRCLKFDNEGYITALSRLENKR